MRTSALAAVLGDRLGAGLIAAFALACVELIALESTSLGLVAVVLALFATLGLLVGAILQAQHWLVRRVRARGPGAAAIHALGALLVLVPVASSLFDGAFASTLPGAALASVWVPALGYLALSATIAIASWWLSRTPESARRVRWLVLGASLCALVGACEWANRTLYPSGYPDLHALLIALSAAALTVALQAFARVIGERAPVHTAAITLSHLGVGVAVLLALATASVTGLSDPEDRWTIAIEGTHTRHMVRIVRTLSDRDGDGFSPLLSGGDCDDGDARKNPGAREIPGNGRDEDCDGVDSALPAPAPPVRSADGQTPSEIRAAWYTSQPVKKLLHASAGFDLVLISVDALRADALAEDRRPALPHLDRFLSESTVFTRAFAPSSGTDLSLGGVVTGRLNPFVPLEQTLAEAMRASGRATHAVIPREVLRFAGKTLLTRGLDRFDEVINDRERDNMASHMTSDETTDLGLAYIDAFLAERNPPGDSTTRASANAPSSFLWVHYFDVHEHDQLPPDREMIAQIDPERALSDKARNYHALVARTDRAIGRLLTGIAERGLAERTIVAFMSDHGESLGEDPRLPDRHGLFVYNALTHVPMAIRIPGVPPTVVDTPVSLIDLHPTLLELAGREIPAEARGISLVPYLLPGAPEHLIDSGRALVMNDQQQWGVIVWPYKLMMRPAENLIELYDIESDPGERRNLAGREAERVRALKDRYAAFPAVHLDRSRQGRRLRERQSQPPAPR